MSKEQAKRIRRRKPGDLGQLRRVLWEVLLEAEALVRSPAQPPAEKVKAMHALATLAGAYMKALELHDLSKKVEELENQVIELRWPA
ncbi:hypothetical protein TthHB5008_12350 [Thermus thermophilus]|uniref:hypothetical protein n=1 Tax=Thermus thermophilus TaxID=274 RepID=UPI0019526B48|nr:hypothetical protein [Thermus thermophilus]BCP98134.1 hypothetical protein TthHB5002_12370 [Thermus thermophilus]BCQ00465.1 hypothetical protein TthHB5008_12350 [Thermus thermophilus]